MSSIDDRLRAADPMFARAYEHPDLDAMIARISAPSTPVFDRQWRLFKLKMATAVGAASIVTVAAVALLQSVVPSLPILELGAAKVATQLPTSSMMMIYERFVFSAGPNLSSSSSLGAAYQVQSPTDSAGEAGRLATIFGVDGTPTDVNGDASSWTATDSAGDTLSYDYYNGLANWYFNSASSISSSTVSGGAPAVGSNGPGDSTPSADASGSVPTQSTLESDVQSLMKKLDYGYTLADPTFSTQQASSGSSGATLNEETVSYQVLVDGTSTDQSAQFTVDASNNLVDASGPAFSVVASTNYPLQSQVAGVAALNSEQQQRFSSSSGSTVAPDAGGVGAGGSTSAGSPPVTTAPPSGSGPGSTGETTTTVQQPPIVDVTLYDATVALATYQLQDGSTWLIPVYDYSGTAFQADGNSYQSTWTTLAVDPAYVHIDVAPSHGIIAY